MIIIKLFDVILNIKDVNILFAINKNQQIFELVKQKYSNICYLESYIIQINKIVNRSLIESNQNDLDCSFNVYVQFEAECLVLNKNEIILDMEIQDNINNNIILKKDNMLAFIKNNKDIQTFNKGDKIPIIVGKAKFTTGSNKISINAYPMIPILNNNIYYYKINKITDNDKKQLHELIIKYIEMEEERKKDINKQKNNKWDYFDNLIYPFNKDNTNNEIKEYKTLDLLSLNYNDNIIFINSNINMSKCLICIDNNITNYIEDNSILILYELLKKYYLHIKLINDLSEMYNTNDMINNNIDIFNIYSKYKK
jgi:hypothetical protein